MKRMLTMALVVISALGSNFALALGLGELKLNSALNEKFDAEIKITNIGDLSRNQILPNLASHEDFARAGVERVFFLTGIKFDVELLGDGNAILSLKTDKIVREPFLNFLVEIHWPSGRLLREYTVLLDPPVFARAPAPIVRQATLTATPSAQARDIVSVQPTRRDAAARAAVTTGTSQPPASGAPSDGKGASVRVKKNDTLWGIAKEHRPGSNVSVRQTMVAIQRHNPDAFIKNNINLLKAGQVLRIPDENEVLDVSYDQAVAETSRQNQEWRDTRETIDTTRKPDDSLLQPVDQEVAAPAEDGQLKLISDEEANATEELASSASGASVEDTQTQVEAMAKTDGQPGEQQETASGADASMELSAANEELLKQVEDLKRLVELKDQQLALLQGVTGQAGEQPTPVETAVAPETSTSDSMVEQLPDENKTTDSVTSIINKLTENPLYIALLILGILVILMIIGAVSRKRNQAQEYPVAQKNTTDRADQEMTFEESMEEDLADIVTDEETEDKADTGKRKTASLNELSDKLTETETDEIQKIIEESDIYIAYGRYERAIEILQPAINDNPDNTELRLKLAEIFVVKKNQSGLTQLEADLQAIGDQDALDEFAELTKQAGESDETVTMEQLDDVTIDEEDLVDDSKKEKAPTGKAPIDFELPEDKGEEPEKRSESIEDELVLEDEAPEEKGKSAKPGSEPVEFEFDISPEKQEEDQEDKDVVEKGKKTDKVEGDEDSLVLEEDADDMDFLGDTDESATKLELAKAYIDMADKEAALDMLNEVVEEGSDAQKEEARKLLEKLG